MEKKILAGRVMYPSDVTEEKIEADFKRWADAGMNRLLWRFVQSAIYQGPIDTGFAMENYTEPARAKHEERKALWERMDFISVPLEIAHDVGLEFYAYVDPWNMGGPPEYGYESQSGFLVKHPEYLAVDRTGTRRQWGILEFAYPEARRFWVDVFEKLMLRYRDLDGIFMDTRTEGVCIDFADQYGFNEPVVKEYERRHGVNILEENFDLERWRRLRGEYFTLFLKESKAVVSRYNAKLGVGTSRGDYIGYPIGNIHLDWRTWVRENLVDQLYLDHYGYCWWNKGERSPKVKPYGFLVDLMHGENHHVMDRERAIGINDAGVDVSEVYGPLCAEHGVELFLGGSYANRFYSEQEQEALLRMPLLTGLTVNRNLWKEL